METPRSLRTPTIGLALTTLTLALTGFAASCAPDATVDADDEDTVTGTDDELSATARAYVTIRHDQRKCASPMCGGWWAKDVNKKNPTERYVSELDFSGTDLDQETADMVRGARDGEVVLRAKLGPQDANGIRKLLVSEAYLGLPGQSPWETDLFYSVTANDPPIQCFTAPCNNLTAKKLNATKTTSYTGTDLEFGDRIDNEWLRARIEEGGALVAGEMYEGQMFPGGPEKLLWVDQVFIKLPETQSCPVVKLMACPDGTTRTWTRDENRCLHPSECVEPGACAAVVPSCPENYSLVSWTGGPFACTEYACDPTWSVPTPE